MNRIQLLEQQVPCAPHAPGGPGRAPAPFSDTTRRCGRHAVFVPLHYEPNYAYPLLIWLHDAGNGEEQLREIIPQISFRNYVAVAPRGTQAQPGFGGPRYTWGQTREEIHLSESRVLECIELAAERFHIAPTRVFLIGSGSGGTMALRLGMLSPQVFAGIVSIGGPFPTGNTPLVRIRQARHLRLLIAHGRKSPSYSESAVCSDLRLLHSAGISVTLRQYPCADQLNAQMLSDVDTWIMQQVMGGGPQSGPIQG